MKGKVAGKLKLLGSSNDPKQQSEFNIEVDFMQRIIHSAENYENVVSMEPIDAVDSARLIYFIKQPDVKFLNTGDQAYLQAKLTA